MNREIINLDNDRSYGAVLFIDNEPSVDTTFINTYWNKVLDDNDKSVKFYRSIHSSPNALTRNSIGLIEANTAKQTNNIYVPLLGLIANDTGSYFQTLDTDFSFFNFEQKIRIVNVRKSSMPQLSAVTTWDNPNKAREIDVLFYAPAFNGGTPILRYEYVLIGSNVPTLRGTIQNSNAIVGFQNEILTPEDKDFRYIFSFNPSVITAGANYTLNIRAVTAAGPSDYLINGPFTTGEYEIRTEKAPDVTNPIKQKR